MPQKNIKPVASKAPAAAPTNVFASRRGAAGKARRAMRVPGRNEGRAEWRAERRYPRGGFGRRRLGPVDRRVDLAEISRTRFAHWRARCDDDHITQLLVDLVRCGET